MPRGIPNARKDETSMRFTSFHVPLQPNPKHVGSSYLKSDSQTIWSRNAQKKLNVDSAQAIPRGSQVVVIHPGSRFLRIGRATHIVPLTMPNIIARKQRRPEGSEPLPVPTYSEGICRPQRTRSMLRDPPPAQPHTGDEYSVAVMSDDPFDQKLASIQMSLRDRMRFYKLRVTTNAPHIASTFNDQFKPEILPEGSDPGRVPFIEDPSPSNDVLVGEQALRLASPHSQGYILRRPLLGRHFNTRDYPPNTSLQFLLSDQETILENALQHEAIAVERHSYKDFSVVLLVPDFYERNYLREWAHLLLVTMGFKQITESLAATYGAGISSACVVDIGAAKTSIACVDDGLVIADTRMSLMMGGDDVTEFLYVLLDRIGFPYRDLDLARSYDWEVMEDLKKRICTLAEPDVALNLYDFVVRRPGHATEKYGLRAYDEIILAPMCIFEPRVVDFDRKRIGLRPSIHPDVDEDIIEHSSDRPTQAMMISTQHLASLLVAPSPLPAIPDTSAITAGPATPSGEATPEGHPSASDSTPVVKSENAAIAEAIVVDGDTDMAEPPSVNVSEPSTAAPTQPATPYPLEPIPPSAYAIDVCFEASKLPLDVAIFNSARAAGGDEKIRKYLQAVLVVGGGSCVSGMAHALESRLQAIATPLVPNMEKVTIIPAPRGTDPQDLCWKGAAVLGKMDGVADLWVSREDWDLLGLRGLKERCFYL
ncbi:actin-like ATPase domain-containing protein [Punctularia strigosozonata HHB-11173 SS5]|uniref:actin-like ATPase domain-containing protein n=1 Tax=Punctularia strigosozonata (strain HHB-11173) TaxID=741275 RepID=UPI0004417930|nr:actin-like ATPase domain-containing protein [Punctularia strigosozonata HHB-11173 SS5]EIN09565.1 actin-like ATPase domain-containing protein [Punctularia strigosozonata HHB-11173 SS5]